MMQAIEEAEAARRVALDEWQQRVATLITRVEALTGTPGAMNAERELASAEADWSLINNEPEVELDPDTGARFAAAVAQAQGAIAEHHRLEAERRAAEEQRTRRSRGLRNAESWSTSLSRRSTRTPQSRHWSARQK